MAQTDTVTKILLIDTDQSTITLIDGLLNDVEDKQYQLDSVSSYKAGLEAIQTHSHHVYLLSHHLDGEHTGLELLEKVNPITCVAPLIFVTHAHNRALDLQAMELGAADYLSKDDLSTELLDRAIRYALRHKESTRRLQQVQQELTSKVAERTAEQSNTNRILQEKITELEALRQEIQASLEWRTNQIEISTQIAQEIAAAPALDTLFRLVVNLVQERFGYYHAHVYTVEQDLLVMQEGTGGPGRMMKEMGHNIPYSAVRSLVAKAARSGEPILVDDVSKDKRWLPNLLLPETKSELAIPIKLGDRVLGVLDVQHNQIGGLTTEDQILLMGLCGQIAVAINNQWLEQERRKALDNQQKLIHELDAFGHTVGHNLKDPVGLIIGYASLVKERARMSDELADYINAILKNAHRLNNIIEELQLLSGIRNQEIKPKPLNMIRIIAEVQQRLAYLIQERGATVTVSEYWPVSLGHAPWVEEVWANYISNAIKYGGDPPRVFLGATAQSDGMVRFWVRDNGPGLSAEQQQKLFAEFTRLNQANLKGHGLGLSIVQRIVHKLGGEVGVTSEGVSGHGSIFTFTLPSANPRHNRL
ncbi:MAG: hypothetical protein Kow0031_02990 [Anaerolineae bacterium]